MAATCSAVAVPAVRVVPVRRVRWALAALTAAPAVPGESRGCSGPEGSAGKAVKGGPLAVKTSRRPLTVCRVALGAPADGVGAGGFCMEPRGPEAAVVPGGQATQAPEV